MGHHAEKRTGEYIILGGGEKDGRRMGDSERNIGVTNVSFIRFLILIKRASHFLKEW